MFSQKILYGLVLIAVIALAGVSWFSYNQTGSLQDFQNQNAELQDQVSELQSQNNALQSQISQLQNQNGEQQDRLSDITYELALQRPLRVLVTAFKWIGDFNPMAGLTIKYSINVTVQNTDVVAVSGLTLTVRLLYKGTLTEVAQSQGYTTQIDMLRAGKSREISGRILATLGSFSVDSAVCAIMLTVNGIVLDERTQGLN